MSLTFDELAELRMDDDGAPSRDLSPWLRWEPGIRRPRPPDFTPAEKLAIVREVVLERKPVSDVCERHRIERSQYYQWQRELFDGGVGAFGHDAGREAGRLAKQVDALQARLSEKDEVIAEISQEYMRLKTASGAL